MTIEYQVFGNSTPNGPPDFTSPLATVSGLTFDTPPLESGTTNTFVILPIDTGTGLICQDKTARVAITLDVNGNDTAGLPMPPLGLTAKAQAGGTAIVSFACMPRSGAKAVKVYAWVASGSPDYSTVWASIVPRDPGGPNRLTISGLANGIAYLISVRASNSLGEEQNTITASVVGQSSGPAAVIGLTATVVP